MKYRAEYRRNGEIIRTTFRDHPKTAQYALGVLNTLGALLAMDSLMGNA